MNHSYTFISYLEVMPSLLCSKLLNSLCTVYTGVLYAFSGGMIHLCVIIDQGISCSKYSVTNVSYLQSFCKMFV